MFPVNIIVPDSEMDRIRRISIENGEDISKTVMDLLKKGLDWEEAQKISPRQFKEFLVTLNNFVEYQAGIEERITLNTELSLRNADALKLILTILLGDAEEAERILKERHSEISEILKKELPL